MKRLGMPVSDDTILGHLKRQVARLCAKTTVRVAGIDDWSWRKGCTYGTIVVDLERREVVDVLQDRTTTGTAEWLGQHPEVEIISRDRCGLYRQGAREGAPQARQVADRFHLLQNLRETIETQLSRADRSTGRALLPESKDEDVVTIAYGPGGRREVAEHRHPTKQAHRRSRQAIFDRIRSLRDAGNSIGDIARETGVWSAQHQKMAAIQRASGPTRHGAKDLLAQLFPRLLLAPLGGRLRSRPRAAPRNEAPRLYRQLLPSVAAPGKVAARQRRQVVTLPPVPEPTTASTPTITTVPCAVDPATGWSISQIVEDASSRADC